MSKTKRLFPGPAAHVLCVVLSLLMMVTLLLCALSGAALRLLTDTQLHASIAANDAVVAAQYEVIGTKVDALSEKYPFTPKTAMDLVTPARVAGYDLQVAAWWLGLTAEAPTMQLPSFAVEGLEEAIREDETFQAGTPSTQRKATARDKIAGGVESIVTETAAPIRTALVSLGLGQVMKRVDVPQLMGYLYYAPAALGLAALVLFLLMLLCCFRWPGTALAYAGGAMGAAGLSLGGVMALVHLLGLTAQVTAMNAILGLQCRLLLTALGGQVGLCAGGLMLLGLLLIGIHQHKHRLREAASPAQGTELAA